MSICEIYNQFKLENTEEMRKLRNQNWTKLVVVVIENTKVHQNVTIFQAYERQEFSFDCSTEDFDVVIEFKRLKRAFTFKWKINLFREFYSSRYLKQNGISNHRVTLTNITFERLKILLTTKPKAKPNKGIEKIKFQ